MRHHLLKEPHLLAGRSPGCRVRGMEEPAAGGRSLLLPVRGRPLREGKGGWASGEPGSAGSLGREGRRLQRDPRCGGLRHRERGYLPGDVPLPQEQGSLECVELVVSDDHKGLKAAITRHFQGASWQRCQVHYVRNLLGMISFAKRKELGADLRGSIQHSHRRANTRLTRFQGVHPPLRSLLEARPITLEETGPSPNRVYFSGRDIARHYTARHYTFLCTLGHFVTSNTIQVQSRHTNADRVLSRCRFVSVMN